MHDCKSSRPRCTLYFAATVQPLTHAKPHLQWNRWNQHDDVWCPWQECILNQAATRQPLVGARERLQQRRCEHEQPLCAASVSATQIAHAA